MPFLTPNRTPEPRSLRRPVLAGPSSIKGWKEKFFFVDDTEWSRRDAEVEQLSAWKAKKTKQNNYKLNEDEVEEVEKLVREEGDVVDILHLTSPQAIEAAELYGPSSLSEAEMDEFTNAVGGLRIPKKPRKKSMTSAAANKGVPEKERLPSTSARVLKIQQRLEPAGGNSEEVSKEVAPLQRKKRKVAELEVRGDEVTEFMPRPSPPQIDLEVKEREEAEVRGPGRSKELIPPHAYQKSLFEATNTTGAKHFLNSTLPEEYAESVRDRASLQRQCEQLQKEKDELQKERGEWEKEKREMQRRLDEVLSSVTELQNENDVLSTKLVLEEPELKKNVNLLVHNGMEEHIGNFLNSSTFKNILKLYRLPTAIVAFTDCRKKVKAQYPEVDVTTVTFGEQEEGVEEDGESLCADFRPQITLRWERDAEGLTIFPPAFDAELVAVEEEEEGVKEAQGAGTLAPIEVEMPPQLAEDEPRSPPLPTEEQPLPPAE
ncbi:hypothetical protein SLEP1_g42915 [Rubroshorea leprosula]|uniref:Uncharacterized protein n=1 Tax=Rubroshorea leprosula TaxID=152421 RepID=A0AAV5LC15_9ROSI|nr:hypothetical protein SLEP1_g42915 [Rubroshorea leprosula]